MTAGLLLALAVGAATHAAPVRITTDGPQPVRSYADLLKLLRQYQPSHGGGSDAVRMLASGLDAAGTASARSGSASAADYSTTNVQVAGVDEADVVKTDGEFIYQVNRRRVLVVRAHPETQLAVHKVLQFADASFTPQEVYVDEHRLVVIGSSWRSVASKRLMISGNSLVKALIYNITDKDKIRLAREVEIEGSYLSSRKIGAYLYLVARNQPPFYWLANSRLATLQDVAPIYRDSDAGNSRRLLSPRNIFWLPDFEEPSYLVVAGFNTRDKQSPLNIRAYLGAGQEVYASLHNLYVSASPWNRFLPVFRGGPVIMAEPLMATVAAVEPARVVRPPVIIPRPPVSEQRTTIYRFAMDRGDITFTGRGVVSGRVLNQFSMDEHNGYFRVATTSGGWWGGAQRNNLFVLDGNLKPAGSLTGLAPGESLYAARFMGNRGYLVTFRQVDPLFVVDLSNPAQPAVLGELKIPGYSNYLHPYDENHLIGFGKDAVASSWGGGLYQGMKIALFEVSDVKNPIELYSEIIGDRGTESELLHNHKALLFDRDKNLLAFPVTIAEIPDKTGGTSAWTYGQPVFQGAMVYELTLTGGFVRKGAITHIPAGEDIWDAYDRHIHRILYIGSNLYTLSDGMVKANDLLSVEEKASLELPPPAAP
jgi:hypothetical protein